VKPIIPLLIFLLMTSFGCASTRFGQDLTPENELSVAQGLKGKDKETLIRTLGDPDFITRDREAEYWGYHRSDSWHLSLYYASAGRIQARDLVVKLMDNHAADAFVIGKGSSMGIISDPLSMKG
jgi:hypothetical protein